MKPEGSTTRTVGWLMEGFDGNPVVVAATNRGAALVRDVSMFGRPGWIIWNDGSCDVTAETATLRYEEDGYTLKVPPSQIDLSEDPWGSGLTGRELDMHIEDCMLPLLGAMEAAVGYLLPLLPPLPEPKEIFIHSDGGVLK